MPGITGVAGLRRWATPSSAKNPLFYSCLGHNGETEAGEGGGGTVTGCVFAHSGFLGVVRGAGQGQPAACMWV